MGLKPVVHNIRINIVSEFSVVVWNFDQKVPVRQKHARTAASKFRKNIKKLFKIIDILLKNVASILPIE